MKILGIAPFGDKTVLFFDEAIGPNEYLAITDKYDNTDVYFTGENWENYSGEYCKSVIEFNRDRKCFNVNSQVRRCRREDWKSVWELLPAGTVNFFDEDDNPGNWSYNKLNNLVSYVIDNERLKNAKL